MVELYIGHWYIIIVWRRTMKLIWWIPLISVSNLI
eukprot:UN10336